MIDLDLPMVCHIPRFHFEECFVGRQSDGQALKMVAAIIR
jgi:hypothetical protein